MDARSAPPEGLDAPALSPPPAVARQRWRLVLARDAGAPSLAGRELVDAWEEALAASGLPVVQPTGRVKSRIAFGAPAPASIVLERELADILLTELVPAWTVREALVARCPDGWRLLDVEDVWLGAPALAGQVAAADYRIELEGGDAQAVAAACAAFLAADRISRQRLKGGAAVEYDLRPLVIDVRLDDAGPPLILHARTRFDPALGTGRPDEVVGALRDLAGHPLEVRSITRERLVLAEDLPTA